jgi:acyl carrier protein
MNFDQVLEAMNRIFVDVLGDPAIALTRATTARDIADWDSLTHMELVVAIEKRFGIKFSLPEVQHLANVGEMADLIVKKTA